MYLRRIFVDTFKCSLGYDLFFIYIVLNSSASIYLGMKIQYKLTL